MNAGYEKVKHILTERNEQSHVKALAKYLENPNYCLQCNKKLNYKRGIRQIRFCSSSCSTRYNNLKRVKKQYFCHNCGCLLHKGCLKFCSKRCQVDYNYKHKVSLWLNGEISGLKGEQVAGFVKRYLTETRGEFCELCGWNEVNLFTNRIPLTVHHIDGSYKSNSIDNLQLLCPNCHSLTEFYGSRNKGHGRERRYRRE